MRRPRRSASRRPTFRRELRPDGGGDGQQRPERHLRRGQRDGDQHGGADDAASHQDGLCDRDGEHDLVQRTRRAARSRSWEPGGAVLQQPDHARQPERGAVGVGRRTCSVARSTGSTRRNRTMCGRRPGRTSGVRSDNDPNQSVSVHNVYTNVMHLSAQLTAAGIPWRSYQEDVQYSTSEEKSGLRRGQAV